MSRLRHQLRDCTGSGTVEMAILLFALLVLTFAILEFARGFWTVNAAEKATQLGVRYAAESDPVASEFLDFDAASDSDFDLRVPDYLTTDVLPPFTIRCTSQTCSCVAGCQTADDVFDEDDYGFGAQVGARMALWRRLDGEAWVRYTSVGELGIERDYSGEFDDDILGGVLLHWTIGNRFGLEAGYEFGEITTWNLGARFEL